VFPSHFAALFKPSLKRFDATFRQQLGCGFAEDLCRCRKLG
jgi:hypothetical protein